MTEEVASTETVEHGPIKAALEGLFPIDPGSTTVYGVAVPKGYKPARYVEQAKRICQGDRQDPLTALDHAKYATWAETRKASKRAAIVSMAYGFALRGLGLVPSEQTARFKQYEIAGMPTEPTANYYPHTLPLELAIIVTAISAVSDHNRKHEANRKRLLRVMALIWHADRLSYYNKDGRVRGQLSTGYIEQHVGASTDKVREDIENLEKYRLIRVTDHGGVGTRRARINAYQPQEDVAGIRPRAWVIVAKGDENNNTSTVPIL